MPQGIIVFGMLREGDSNDALVRCRELKRHFGCIGGIMDRHAALPLLAKRWLWLLASARCERKARFAPLLELSDCAVRAGAVEGKGGSS